MPLEMLFHWEKLTPDQIYLKQPAPGGLRTWTWKQTADEVRRLAGAIHALGLPPGTKIALISKNCAHWIIADFAIWMSGHVSVPLYPNLSGELFKKTLEHSEAKFLLVGKLDDWKSLIPWLPLGLRTIAFPAYYGTLSALENWDSFVKGTTPLAAPVARNETDLATLIYTSGTTGDIKGVMHNFKSFSFSGSQIVKELNVNQSDRFFSYLPLAHVAERLLTETVGLYCGGQISFAESLETFADNLRETEPTVFLGVPRIWAKFQAGILAKVPQAKLDRLLSIPLVSTLIRRKLRKALGLNKVQIAVTGAAPTPPSLIDWFSKIGISIQEAYGMTENFAYSHINRRERIRVGTVGQPWEAVATQIGDGEEILIECPALMMGYYKEPEMSAQVLVGGFLHTGDQGEVDLQGYLKITGRVKDLFKTSKGKYVAPGPIETLLGCYPYFEHVCVVGSGLPQPMALVVLNETARKTDGAALHRELDLTRELINKKLEGHERMTKIVIIPDNWAADPDLVTPTLKLKRNRIEKKYQSRFDSWSGSDQSIIQN